MKILVIGSGGREHALAWKLLQSSRVQSLVLAPGNDAALVQLQTQFSTKQVTAWKDSIAGSAALQALTEKSLAAGIDFVVVGPDNALADGAVDIFTAAGLPSFGPTQAAAQLESSKIFSKNVMKVAGIPTAEFFESRGLEATEALLQKLNWNKHWVLKADGLALGKGVEICESLDEALKALQRLKAFSTSFVIEERLFGSEISWLAFCDGDECSLLPPAQDYKTLTDDPLSPNTGGMGAVCPVPGLSSALALQVREQVFLPLLQEMKKRGAPYRGVLYAGLMIHDSRFWVLEFNARFGDPEAQALMAVMDIDLLEWCKACATPTGLREKPREVPMNGKKAVYVVAAAEGYPVQAKNGARIDGIESWLKSHQGFFAGVRRQDQDWVTAGGRVLGALGLGVSFSEARAQAFERLSQIHFQGQQVRQSVGKEWL